jgi:spore maturation protein SpmB
MSIQSSAFIAHGYREVSKERGFAMDTQAREAREALIAVLSTAAAMGVDIDLLCHRSVELFGDDVHEGVKPYAAGAIYQIAVCMNYVIDAPEAPRSLP